jgi:TIR domain-containing protein
MGHETFDVFVSYARADSRHAADIVSVLRARGLAPFFDRSNLSPGLPWVRGLEKALNAAKAAIILIGPHGLGNTQQYERDLAIVRQTRDPSFPIVPVILPEAEIDRPFNFLQILTWHPSPLRHGRSRYIDRFLVCGVCPCAGSDESAIGRHRDRVDFPYVSRPNRHADRRSNCPSGSDHTRNVLSSAPVTAIRPAASTPTPLIGAVCMPGSTTSTGCS